LDAMDKGESKCHTRIANDPVNEHGAAIWDVLHVTAFGSDLLARRKGIACTPSGEFEEPATI
jgi:hypothetical protein